MGKPKYIQQTDWWEEVRKAGVEALDREYHKTMDEAIIEALNVESMLKVEAGGRGRPGSASL